MKKRFNSSSGGFTLIEIIIVIVVVAVLAGIAIPSIGAYMRHGRVAAATADANMLASALNIYKSTVIGGSGITAATDVTETQLSNAGILPQLTNPYATVQTWVLFDNAAGGTLMFYVNTAAVNAIS